MQKLLFFITFFLSLTTLNAQKNMFNYNKTWKNIDSLLIIQNKTKTALQEVNGLLDKAINEQNYNQQAKAYLYKINLEEQITDSYNPQEKINALEKEIILKKDAVLQSIMKLYALKMYINFYNENKWNLTNTATDVKNKTLLQLSKKEIIALINNKAINILQPADVLWNTNAKTYTSIVNNGDNNALRNTMYELIAYALIEQLTYLNENEGIEESSIINNKNIIATLPIFIKNPIKPTGTNDIIFWMYQNLIKYHFSNNNTLNLIDADINRLNFAYKLQHQTPTLYIAALDYLINTYNTNAQTVWAVINKAKTLVAEGDKYTNNPNNRFKKKEALQVIDDFFNNNNNIDSTAVVYLNQIKSQIVAKRLSAKLEAVNVPNVPFRMLVNFKNTTSLHYKIIKLKNGFSTDESNDLFNINDEKGWEKILNKKTIATNNIVLPTTTDYQPHLTEVKMDALSAGKYVLVGASSAEYSYKEDAFFYIPFAISNIACIQNGLDVFIVQRDNGQPIANAEIKVLINKYDVKKSRYKNEVVQTFTSDKNGFGRVTINTNSNFSLYIKSNDDEVLNTASYVYESVNNKQNDISQNNVDFAKVHFFTDRSIYRPQQKVNFKGILLTKDNYQSAYKLYNSPKEITIELLDANYTIIDTQTLSINEFGSFNGSFLLPKQMLTGNCTIKTKTYAGNSNFKVEAYKRPTFFIEFKEENKTYKLNTIVTLKANAKSFAGNNIDNGKMSFVVKRQEQIAYTWDFNRFPYYNNEPTLIEFGNGVTDNEGNFNISFTALANNNTNKKENAIFIYTIEAKVTDNKGETRETSYTVKVGTQNTIINLDVPEKINAIAFTNFKLSTINLQDKLVSKLVKITWQPLVTEQRLIRKRLWQMPDTFVMNKETYINYFPNDEYSNETNPKNWKTLETIATQEIKTSEDASKNKFNVPLEVVANTFYKVTATVKDDNGENVLMEKMIEITTNSNSVMPTYHSFELNKSNFTIADTIYANLQSSANELFIIKNKIVPNYKENESLQTNHFEFVTQKTNNKYNLIPVQTLQNADNFAVYYAFVHHNRFFTNGQNINIYLPENKLQISYNSFRNKTLPGSKETYSLSIKGSTENKENAELLSAMYDASLDEIYNHQWDIPFVGKSDRALNNEFYCTLTDNIIDAQEKYYYTKDLDFYINYKKIAHSLDDVNFVQTNKRYRNNRYKMGSKMYQKQIAYDDGIVVGMNASPMVALSAKENVDINFKSEINDKEDAKKEDAFTKSKKTNNNQPLNNIVVRKNFKETAFFIPNIYSNDSGVYSFTVTLPESLTTWKWQNFAHTKNLALGLNAQTIITQKTLMVQPNIPRFFIQGDVIELATTIANTSDAELTGTCTLQLFNAITNTPIDGWFNNIFPAQYFTVNKNGSTVVKFPIQVPQNFTDAVTYKIIAQTIADKEINNFSDGEENTLPVLSNKLYLTNAMPLYLKSNEQVKKINYPFLKQALEQQNNIQPQAVTVEYTPNSIFTVIKALPYLIEYPYECAEQTFNRLFAYTIASSLINKNKTIKQVVEYWKNTDSTNLQSNLVNNTALQQILINETPWVNDANNQTATLKKIASLLSTDNVNNNLLPTLNKLAEMQLPNGGFSWFKGGTQNMYITQYILIGLGKLLQYNLLEKPQQEIVLKIITNALPMLDNAMQKQYLQYKKLSKNKKISVLPLDVQYWYMRSMFINESNKSFPTAYFKLSFAEFANKWRFYSIQQQAMLSIAFNNYKEVAPKYSSISQTIAESFIENAIEDSTHDLLYFKTNTFNCYWYDNNFETQAYAIEALQQFQKFDVSTQKFKNWFLYHKQTNNWESTIATSSACFALLNQQKNNIEVQKVNIKIGNKIASSNNSIDGNVKETYTTKDLLQLSSEIEVSTTSTNSNQTPSYGAVYVQYFQPIEDVKQSVHPYLNINKKIFIKRNNKEILEEVKENELVNIGDELVVQLNIDCKKALEFVHVKDGRAAGTEPKNVLSQHKWQQGLSYYEVTKDANTLFFIDNLPKGNFTLQYSLNVTHAGSFNTGLATIQCLYAPSFIANTSGVVLKVQ